MTLRCRRPPALVLVVALVLVAGAITVPSARGAEGDVTVFQLPDHNSPTYVAAGPDGNVWFTSPVAFGSVANIGRITPSGTTSFYPVPTPRAFGDPYQITLGPDGNLWFTEIFGGKVGKVTPAGAITEFTVGGQPTGITTGPDGKLWFADMGVNALRSISTSGDLGTSVSGLNNPREVVTGSDGNLWVSEGNANAISRISPAGSTTRFSLPSSTFAPNGVALGRDGNVWFTSFTAIGKITPSGAITLFAPPTEGSWPFDITSGPDGNLWFTERNRGGIGRSTPSGTITEFASPLGPGLLGGIASGPDRAMWFTAQDAEQIGRIEVAVTDTTPPVISVPSALSVNATAPTGATVAYTATATDDFDPNPTLTCSPSSGSVFPIGSTVVTCTASDANGNTAHASFDVHVAGAAEQIDDLLALVKSYDLSTLGTSLQDKLTIAQKLLAEGKRAPACEVLVSFLNQVNAQRGKWLTTVQADALATDARRIRAVVGC